jgi:hypothetical protein
MTAEPSAIRIDRIDRRTASRNAVPAIGDLNGLRCCSGCGLTIATTAVARDDADFRVARQPGLDRGGLAIGEQVDDASPFEIADDAPVTLAALPGPIIDADHAQGRAIAGSVSANNTQQSVFAYRQH